MVRGLDRFRAHFANYSDRYAFIGGTACSIAFEDVGLDFRATKDLDIVICVEALDSEFVSVFWEFVRDGGYKNQQKSTDRKLFYRFYDPEDTSFPVMLELFARVPEVLSIDVNHHLTPIPVDDEISSLSAILLNDDYYYFIHEGKLVVGGLPIIMPAHLIPLKVKAWLDLTQRRAAGEKVDQRDIRKHRNDVFRLYQLITPNTRVKTPDAIKHDLTLFLTRMSGDTSFDISGLKLPNKSLVDIISNLCVMYGLDIITQ